MACPLFIPCSPLGELVSIAPPLGDLYGGECEADRTAVIEPEILRRYCNFGYARGICERSAIADADAVRLLVKADTAGDAGRSIELAWALERNHLPVAVGTMEIRADAAAAAEDPLSRQAFACVAAYLRQSHSASKQ